MASGFSVRSVHQSRRMKPGSVFKRKPAPDLIREPAPDLIREPAPDLIRGGGPVRVKKTRQLENLQPRFDSIEAEKASRLVRPKNHERRLARANNVRKALVACTVSMAFSSALRSDLTASSCSDLNSIHSTELSLVINR